jgi:RNA polymerase sigma factor (sigma-70 family)
MDDFDHPVVELVAAAAAGDEAAWNELVDRYSPLLVSVIRRFGLSPVQVEDVAQTVWLRLVEHLGRLREPQALRSWLTTTAKNECIRNLSINRRTVSQDPLADTWPASARVEDDTAEALLKAELHEALLAGLAELPKHQREVLLLLANDPPLTYAQISSKLSLPVGSIGPTRGRAIEALRRTPPISAFLTDNPSPDKGR